MNKKELMKKLFAIGEELTESIGFELVDLEFIKEFGSYFLRVYIDKEGGITLDDCQEMSELLSERLDLEDPIEQAYYLEVSSPGLDRPLKTDKDLRRNLGKEIEISLYKPLDNRKKYEGILENFTEEKILIATDNKQIDIPRDAISTIKLALKF